MRKKILIVLSLAVIVAIAIGIFAFVSLKPQQQGNEDIYFWVALETSEPEWKLIVFIENNGDEVVVLKRIVLPDYGYKTPLKELARIQPNTTLPYLLLQDPQDHALINRLSSVEYLRLRIVTEKGVYEWD